MNTINAVKQVLLRSGTAWILWSLGVLSLASIALVVERWLFYRARDCDLPELARTVGGHLASGDRAAASAALRQSRSLAGDIAAAGLELADRGAAAADKAMQSAVALQRVALERSLAYLGTLGNNAPFIGLFGTVVGVIGAFEALGQTVSRPSRGAVAATQLASQAVMASIAEALVATAVGILVALPAVVAFNYFQRRVVSLLSATEGLTNLVLAYLIEADPSHEGPAPERAA
jgi:biopolymer transport protein ExbB